MKIYFAGSIRGGRDDQQLYAEIIKTLSSYGKVLTEHVGDKKVTAWGEDGPTEKYIHDRDINWLKEADVVVAEVSTASLGVGYEVAKAEEWGKKILCLYRETEGKRLSAMITGSGTLETKTYETLDDLKQIFEVFF
jgi:hypothetical protein